MKTGEIEDAKRWALNLFDEWVDATGVVSRGTGYYYEMQGIVKDAVEIGAGLACGASRQEILERIKHEQLRQLLARKKGSSLATFTDDELRRCWACVGKGEKA